jgi:hypothetical protein
MLVKRTRSNKIAIRRNTLFRLCGLRALSLPSVVLLSHQWSGRRRTAGVALLVVGRGRAAFVRAAMRHALRTPRKFPMTRWFEERRVGRKKTQKTQKVRRSPAFRPVGPLPARLSLSPM